LKYCDLLTKNVQTYLTWIESNEMENMHR